MENTASYRSPASNTSLSSQYWDVVTRKGYTQPEKYLMLAVLKDAILEYRNNFASQNTLYQKSRTWFFEESSDRLFSFESICDTLNLNPNVIRKELLTKGHVRSGRC
jgi:hypothetical protein